MWLQFRDYLPQFDFESGPPGEDSFWAFFKYLRLEKNNASTTLWTWYSCVNSMMKRKYVKLQNLPRLTMVIKDFDTDVKEKALIFDETEITFMLVIMESAFWFVRQAITIVAFFGGLRLQECQDLKLEKIIRAQDGFKIVHCRVKQRSDQRKTAFIVAAEGRFADRLAVYLNKIHTGLNNYNGRVWWTSTKGLIFKNIPMGRNMISKVPHAVTTRLNKENPELYTFHSYRRASAISAANGSMTSDQMQSFFGWKHPSMCQEYISTSRTSLLYMA